MTTSHSPIAMRWGRQQCYQHHKLYNKTLQLFLKINWAFLLSLAGNISKFHFSRSEETWICDRPDGWRMAGEKMEHNKDKTEIKLWKSEIKEQQTTKNILKSFKLYQYVYFRGQTRYNKTKQKNAVTKSLRSIFYGTSVSQARYSHKYIHFVFIFEEKQLQHS